MGNSEFCNKMDSVEVVYEYAILGYVTYAYSRYHLAKPQPWARAWQNQKKQASSPV